MMTKPAPAGNTAHNNKKEKDVCPLSTKERLPPSRRKRQAEGAVGMSEKGKAFLAVPFEGS